MNKRLITSLLAMACIGSAPVLADNATVQAAVIVQETNAEMRASNSLRSTGRQIFEVGEVYEVHGASGLRIELKLDDSQIAVLPRSAVHIRSCTPAELAEAQTKFNALSNESQRKARMETSAAKREATASAAKSSGGGTCATCPKVRDAAAAAIAANAVKARKEYLEKSKALREKNRSLASEAIAWARTGE